MFYPALLSAAAVLAAPAEFCRFFLARGVGRCAGGGGPGQYPLPARDTGRGRTDHAARGECRAGC